MNWVVWVFIAFLCGALPFSVWLGKLFLGIDMRRVGDGNPGATNAFRSGSKLVGLLVLILDISKAAAPVGIAYNQMGIRGLPMFFIAIAPIIGHVFSPFLGFRGGKGLATAFGVWIGLTLWKASLLGVIGAVIGLSLFATSGWAVMLALVTIFIGLLIWIPDPLLFWVWAGETIIMAWTYRGDLRQGPRLHPRLAARVFPSKDYLKHG